MFTGDVPEALQRHNMTIVLSALQMFCLVSGFSISMWARNSTISTFGSHENWKRVITVKN